MWVGPSFKEDKSCWELSGVSSWKFNVPVKTALPMPCVVDLNFKPFLPFFLFDFPLSESFQRRLLIHPHLSRGSQGCLWC